VKMKNGLEKGWRGGRTMDPWGVSDSDRINDGVLQRGRLENVGIEQDRFRPLRRMGRFLTKGGSELQSHLT
jgi:hypothetical protein